MLAHPSPLHINTHCLFIPISLKPPHNAMVYNGLETNFIHFDNGDINNAR